MSILALNYKNRLQMGFSNLIVLQKGLLMQDWVFRLVSRLENLCEKIASLSDLEKLVSLVLKMKDNLTTWKLEIAVFNCPLCLNSPVRIL